MSRKIQLNQKQFANICEMIAYHGTGAEFDKFNHKKYLNTGAKSQSFGWGTYVTDDRYVALGYSNASKDHMINMSSLGEEIVNHLTYMIVSKYGKYGISNSKAYEFVERTVRSYENDFDQVVNDIDWLEERLISNEKLKDSVRLELKMQYDILWYLKYKFENQSFLYTVEIPEDRGTNYIGWYDMFSGSFMSRVINGFLLLHKKQLIAVATNDYTFREGLYNKIQWMKENPENADKMIELLSKDGKYDTFFGASYFNVERKGDGRSIYLRLSSLFGSPKAASLFLMQCGFDGIKYPAGTIWKKPDGAGDDAYNYVIFDSNNVNIIKKERI